jgi:hypothetical protein
MYNKYSRLTEIHRQQREKRKRKEMNKKKLQQAIESQTKARSKISWRRKVSNPLGKGSGSTHPRQPSSSKERKLPKQSSNNHKELTLHTCKLPLHQCNSPWTNACKPLENRAAATTSAHTGQTGHHHRSDRCPTCAQGQYSDRSDRWPRQVRPVHNRA